MQYGVSRFPLSSHFFLTANEKDFSHSLEMTIWGKRHSRIVSLLTLEGFAIGKTAFSLLPLEGGAPKGRRLAHHGIKKWIEAFPRFVIPSAAEGSFSFPVSVFLRKAA